MRNYLEACVDYIEHRLDQNLTLDSISEAIGFSKYYLNPIFSTYTGMSIMQYVRKRKIHHGLVHYIQGDPLAAVAENLGYSSERAFSRAVVNEYGKSPSYFKGYSLPQNSPLKIYDLTLNLPENMLEKPVPPSQNSIQTLLIEKGVNAMKSYLSPVRYEILPAMIVLSGAAFGNEPEDDIIDRMNRLANTYNLNVTRQFGFDVPVDSDQDVTTYRGYELWLVVSDSELQKINTAANGTFIFEETPVSVKRIPSFRYATLTIDDPMSAPFERIPGGWRALMAWLEVHDFKDTQFTPPSSAKCLEEVIEGTSMRIYVPVG